jgi:hypothetical protein
VLKSMRAQLPSASSVCFGEAAQTLGSHLPGQQQLQ